MCDRIKKIEEEQKDGYDAEQLQANNQRYQESLAILNKSNCQNFVKQLDQCMDQYQEEHGVRDWRQCQNELQEMKQCFQMKQQAKLQ